MGDLLMVLVPTRSRPQNIGRIIDAWWRTGAFDVAQLRFVVDRDDAEWSRYMEVLERHPECVVHSMPEWQPMVPKLNQAAMTCAERGDYGYFAFMGDDHIPRTPRWAHMLLEQHMVPRHGKKAMFQYGRDGYQDEKLPTWWSVDRDWVMTLGRMVPAPVQHLYCDNAMLELARSAAVGRFNPDILIEHMHPVAGKGPDDPQYRRVNRGEQYHRDGMAFEGWLRDGLARDVSLLRGVAGG